MSNSIQSRKDDKELESSEYSQATKDKDRRKCENMPLKVSQSTYKDGKLTSDVEQY